MGTSSPGHSEVNDPGPPFASRLLQPCGSQRDFRARLRSPSALLPYSLNNHTFSWGSKFKFQGLQVSFDTGDHLPPQPQNYTFHEDPHLLKLNPGSCPSSAYISPPAHLPPHFESRRGSMCLQRDTHPSFRGAQLKVQRATKQNKTLTFLPTWSPASASPPSPFYRGYFSPIITEAAAPPPPQV